jgi:outer membrane protein assembly factor BamB
MLSHAIRLVALCTLLSLAVASPAQEWTRFRGSDGSGAGKLKNFPSTLTPQNALWRVALPGGGHSSPVLWGAKIFLTSAEPEQGKRHLLCLNAQNGQLLWKKTYAFQPYRQHEFNSFASSTPSVDAERVYFSWATPESVTLHALDHQGREVWARELGKTTLQHGGANSPVLAEDCVLLCVDQEGETEEGAFFALDKKTGVPRWTRPRKPSRGAPYATPLLYKNAKGKTEVILSSTAHGLTSLDPKTGSLNWETPNLFPARCVSSPVLVGDMIVATCGSGGGDRSAAAVRLPSPKRPNPEVVYKMTRGVSYVPTPLFVAGRLYFWGDGGVVTCCKPETGETLWRERVGGDFFGSPVVAEGKIFAVSAKGELVVLAVSEKFQVLSRYDLGETCHTTPAIANGTLYVRTESHLIAIGEKRLEAK